MPPVPYIPPLAAGLVTLAWIRQASGDPAGALEAIAEAKHASPRTAGLLNPVPAQRARLLLAQGDLAAAARWTAESGLDADDEPDYPREPGYLVLARVLLAQARPGRGARAAGPAARRGGRPGPGRQRDRGRRAAGAGAGRLAARTPRGERARRGAHAGLPAGLCPGLRRRGPADGRAAGPADRGPAGRRRPPRGSRSAAWPGSSAPLTRRHIAPGPGRGPHGGAGPGRAADQP